MNKAYPNLEKKRDAFAAYDASKMSDEQLKTARESLRDLVETMIAMGIRGAPVAGFIQMEISLQGYIDARARDKRENQFIGVAG